MFRRACSPVREIESCLCQSWKPKHVSHLIWKCSVRPGFAHCTMNSDSSTAELFVLQFHSARGAEIATNDWKISNHRNCQSNFEVTNTYLLSWIACCRKFKTRVNFAILSQGRIPPEHTVSFQDFRSLLLTVIYNQQVSTMHTYSWFFLWNRNIHF